MEVTSSAWGRPTQDQTWVELLGGGIFSGGGCNGYTCNTKDTVIRYHL